MGNIHVKLYLTWTSGSGGNVVSRKSLRTHKGGMDDGQRPITIAHLQRRAFGSSELNNLSDCSH